MATQIHITEPKFENLEFFIRGTAPLVVHKFSQKAMLAIRKKQEEGGSSRKGSRAAKDFNALFNGARHISEEGWDGIPAAAFRCALISACKLTDLKMTRAKLSVFIHADGLDATEGTPLVKILGDDPEQFESMVRIGSGMTTTTDIAVRALYRHWGARLVVRYDAEQLKADDVANLLMRAGIQIGVCEGRPDSKNSAGMGWGTFELVRSKEEITKPVEKVKLVKGETK